MKFEELLSAIYDYYQQNKPEKIPFVFRAPATADDVNATQAALSLQLPFPNELSVLYLRFGMLDHVWDKVTVDAVTYIPENHKVLLEISESYGPVEHVKGPVTDVAHAPTRIPFANDNDRTISIDLSPPEGGKPGQIVRLDLEFGEIEVIADSLLEFFETGLEQLKGGF